MKTFAVQAIALSVAAVGFAGPLPAQSPRGLLAPADVTSEGKVGNDSSVLTAVSDDGLVVAYLSFSSDLVPGDTNQVRDTFVHDRRSGVTTRVSVSSTGLEGDAASEQALDLSADGRLVLFSSDASNLVPGDTNGTTDLFVHDRRDGTTRRVNVDSAGNQSDDFVDDASISGDGRYVAFSSYASNLTSIPVLPLTSQVYLHDLSTGRTTMVSVSPQLQPAPSAEGKPALSRDGRSIAFSGFGHGLIPGHTNDKLEIIVFDRATGLHELASATSTGGDANGWSSSPSLSSDGRYVVFESFASNMVPRDTPFTPDVFVRDRRTGELTCVSVNRADQPGWNFGNPWWDGETRPTVTDDGRWVTFASDHEDLVAGDTNDCHDVFLRDLVLGTTERVSVDARGNGTYGCGEFPNMSPDGRFLTFRGGYLLPHGAPYAGIFLLDREGCSATVGTHCTSSSTSLPGCAAAISASGAPSLSHPANFTITSGPIPGGNLGLAYFGFAGPDSSPFGSQGGATCVAAPFLRSRLLDGGGTPGGCDGELALTLADLVAAAPGELHPRDLVHLALWFRDPQSPDGYGLSDGLWFNACP